MKPASDFSFIQLSNSRAVILSFSKIISGSFQINEMMTGYPM